MDFETTFARVVGHEGVLSLDPKDSGNWTLGYVGGGVLKGSKYGISAACLDPSTRVLMRDLSWRCNGDLVVGDDVIGFVNTPARRGMQLEPSTVLAIDEIALPAIVIETEKREVIASKEHLWWICRPAGAAREYRWQMTCDLRRGDEIACYRDPWDFRPEPGAQWLAGILDGEGNLSDHSISIFQNEGVVAARIRYELNALGLRWSEDRRPGGNIRFSLIGSSFELLGALRPVRMIEKAERFWRGRCTHGRYNAVEKVVALGDAGDRPVMAMITSTGTLIAEGLLSHNSYPDLDIANLTVDGAKQIYRRDFWDRIHADELPPEVVFQAFDFAANSGIGNAVRNYQRALGVADDGKWGPVTREAAKAMTATDQIMRLNAERLDFMTRTSGWPAQGKGWARRIANNLRYGAVDS